MNPTRVRGPNKCKTCRNVGHNAKNCPQNQSLVLLLTIPHIPAQQEVPILPPILQDQDYRHESDDEGGDDDVEQLARALDVVDGLVDDEDDEDEYILKVVEDARWEIITVPNVTDGRNTRTSPSAYGLEGPKPEFNGRVTT